MYKRTILSTKNYILKNKDIPLIELQYNEVAVDSDDLQCTKFELNNINVHLENKHLLPKEILSSLDNLSSGLYKWLERRQISQKRRTGNRIRYFLDRNTANEFFAFMEVGHGVSLNDTYWIVPADSDLRWDDWSPYRNQLDKEIADIAFTAYIYELPPDLPKGSRVPRITAEPTTTGEMRKCWINKDDGIYLRKAYDWRIMPGKRSSAVMEYYASQLAEAMEIPHVPYTLSKYIRSNGKEDIICECPLFTSEDIGFVSAISVIEETGISWSKHNLDSPYLHKEFAKLFGEKFYADMMLFDSIFLNYDRHLGNFGMLIDNNKGKYLGPAPLFDNGATYLFCETDLNQIRARRKEILPYCGAYMLFDEAALAFVEERHIPILKKLTKFKFVQPDDPSLGVDDSVLTEMNRIIRERSKHIIELFDRKQLELHGKNWKLLKFIKTWRKTPVFRHGECQWR